MSHLSLYIHLWRAFKIYKFSLFSKKTILIFLQNRLINFPPPYTIHKKDSSKNLYIYTFIHSIVVLALEYQPFWSYLKKFTGGGVENTPSPQGRGEGRSGQTQLRAHATMNYKNREISIYINGLG